MKKVVRRSRDVTFNENAVYKDNLAVDSEFTKILQEIVGVQIMFQLF